MAIGFKRIQDGAIVRNEYGEILDEGKKNYDDGYSSQICILRLKTSIEYA